MRGLAAIGIALLAASSASAASAVHTRTDDVRAIVATPGTIWVATGGGVEVYDPVALERRRVFTTLDGLASNDVRELRVEGGSVIARTADAACYLAAGGQTGAASLAGARFACAPAPRLAPPPLAIAPTFAGHRVTARIALADGRGLVGTSAGLFAGEESAPRRLTPSGACSNHVMAFAEHGHAIWLGTFDQGVCRWDGTGFVAVPAPFRMVNDLVATPRGLYVAAGEGLFVTRDGRTFARVGGAPEPSYNDLAFDGRSLYATTPAVLRRMPITRGAPRARAWWQPGDSRSLQAVAVGGGHVWVATEDKGVLLVGERETLVFDRAAGLPTSWALDVAALADGTAAVATLRDGLLRVTAAGAVTPLAAPDPWLLHVSVDRDGEALWVGGQGGMARLARASTPPIRGPSAARRAELDEPPGAMRGLPNPNVHAIFARGGGEVWIGTEGGTLVVSPL